MNPSASSRGAAMAMLALSAVGFPAAPTLEDCLDCAFEDWECPFAATSAHVLQYLNFTHQIGACWDEFPSDANVMAVDLDVECAFGDDLDCSNPQTRDFGNISMLDGCSRVGVGSPALVNETCSWRCRASRQIAHCEWAFRPPPGLPDVAGALEACWVTPTAIGSDRVEVSVVCRPSESARTWAQMEESIAKFNDMVDELQSNASKVPNVMIDHLFDSVLPAMRKQILNAEETPESIRDMDEPEMLRPLDKKWNEFGRQLRNMQGQVKVLQERIVGLDDQAISKLQANEEEIVELLGKVQVMLDVFESKRPPPSPTFRDGRRENMESDNTRKGRRFVLFGVVVLFVILCGTCAALAIICMTLRQVRKNLAANSSAAPPRHAPMHPGDALEGGDSNAVVVGRAIEGSARAAASPRPLPSGRSPAAESGTGKARAA